MKIIANKKIGSFEPILYIEPFVNAGADIITFHYECYASNYIGSEEELISNTISQIKSFSKKAGMSIKPKTPADVVFPYLNDLDMVLVMTVEPGFGGQKFMQDCAKKIPLIKEKASQDLIIQVDGGINAETARICTSYGANSLVAGNYIYNSENILTAVNSLR